MLWLANLLAVSVFGGGGAAAAVKPAELVVEAPWRAPSESLLALETISLYNASSYFPALTLLINEELKCEQRLSATTLLNSAVDAKLLDASLLGLVQTELALGTQLPVFEGQYQLFESAIEESTDKLGDCAVVSWIEGQYSCDITDLYALQSSATPQIPQLFKNDHVIGSGPQWIVIYADLDSPEFQDWHSVLLEMAIADKVTYILRYRPPRNSEQDPIQLAGYGAAFHLKRTDYLVVDDRQLDGELNLDVDAPTKVPASKLPFLGFHAAQQIRNASSTSSSPSSKSQLELLKDISYNFPHHAVELAKTASEADIEAELKHNKLDNAMGMNALLINGQLFNGHDAFDFFDAVHRELNIKNTLDASMPNGTDSSALLISGIALDNYFNSSESTITKQRCDLRAGASAIGWINDVEKDPLFSSLSTDVEEIRDVAGPFVPLRQNMHSIVVVGELDDMRVLMLLKDILQQTGRSLPLQIGIVSQDPVWQRVAQLGLEARQAFLIQKILGSSSKEAEIHAREAYSTASDPEKTPLSDPREWLERFDLLEASAEQPIVLANGVPVPLNSIGDWLQIFQADFEFLKSNGAFEDSITSYRDLLFSQGLPTRLDLVDPLGEVVFTPWPLTSPIQAFKNPELVDSTNPKHSVLFSSSFRTPEAFEIADALLARSAEQKDLEVFIRPLSGIDEKFYAAIVDPTFNTFKFSRDLFKAVKLHFFEKKTAPKLLTAAREPVTSTDYLPVDTDSLVIDGRYVEIEGVALTSELLDRIVDRETPRLARISKAVPGIDGIAVAALTAATQGRDILVDRSEEPDIRIGKQGGGTAAAPLKITVIIDPASSEGQQMVSWADLAVDANLDLDIFLSPNELTEMPTRIYRPVLNRHTGGAKFDNLGENVLYTAEIVEPSGWLTTSSKCSYDLDNVLLNMVKENSLRAVYVLKGLLVQGFARGQDAPGTPLTMRSSNGTKISETSVMANLGYFQLLAPKPGVYDLYINAPKSFHSLGQYVNSLSVPVFSMKGIAFNTEIADRSPDHVKHPPHKSSGGAGKSSWKKLKSLAGLGEEFDDAPSSKAAINIFTVASGHLYERFASIMMLSVMKHTKHTVKFWLIENFMSPKFKEFVPELAKKYDFDYEFVTYKWPSWLRAQTEKQRQIWGYKILFLDVLFPQDLQNIIFVDSDQIVRTDFKELLDIDLDGAPYAFTPMGDDREEMEPYRFWKQGYWKKALIDNGLPYHISALFRVDLNRFRKLKTGDVLRQQYQRLSSKAENLANLDQDLPNSLQAIVPIYSLPPEWLWCETWCSDAGLPWAKTIDLCNNPLTKEPKLDRARRQIPEWTQYDDEVSQLAKSLESKQIIPTEATPKSEKAAAKMSRQTKEYRDHDEL